MNLLSRASLSVIYKTENIFNYSIDWFAASDPTVIIIYLVYLSLHFYVSKIRFSFVFLSLILSQSASQYIVSGLPRDGRLTWFCNCSTSSVRWCTLCSCLDDSLTYALFSSSILTFSSSNYEKNNAAKEYLINF